MKKVVTFIYVFLLLVIITGVIYTSYNIPNSNPHSSTASLRANGAVDAINSYAFKQYQETKENSSNIIFSPYSVSTCLSMIYEGARGETAKEMQALFGWSSDELDRLESTAYLIDLLSSPESGCVVTTVNSIWAQENFHIKTNYLDKITTSYRGEATNIDFTKSTEATNQINEWVSTKTNDRIKELFDEGMITPDTLMVLVNAVYFKGEWKHQFGSRTFDQNFTISPDHQVPVKMMYMRDKHFNYTETRDAQILEMEYVDGDYSMVLILPKNSLEEVERSLDYRQFSKWLDALEDTEMILNIPKFCVSEGYKMKYDLSRLGMPSVFTPSADFSGISAQGGMWLDNVVHEAYLNLTAWGTEAAAATGGVYVMSLPQGVTFRADHPFLFAIIEKETRLILFLGRLVEPS